MTIPKDGQKSGKALSVTAGDSSPKGRAKGLPRYIACWCNGVAHLFTYAAGG